MALTTTPTAAAGPATGWGGSPVTRTTVVVLFGIGATSGIQLMNFTVTGLSVICLLAAPAVLLMRHRGVDLLPALLAGVGWLSFLASGLVNDVGPLWPNSVAVAAFALYFLGLTVITGRDVDAIATVLGGIGLGTVIYFLTTGIALTQTGSFLDLWKYGIAHGATLLLLFVLTRARASATLQAGALIVLCVASLALNFRSHALVCVVAALILIVARVARDRIGRGTQLGLVVLFGVGFSYLMPAVARSGLLGSAVQEKSMSQDASGLSLLIAGRTEPPMSLTAIAERPWLGWGGAHNLTPDTYARAEHLAVAFGYDPTFPFYLYWRLPVFDYSAMHSILLGSWAEGGILAVLLPVSLLIMCGAIVYHNDRFGVWTPLVLVVALQGIWDLLYAPWTYNMVPEYACIALLFCATHFLRPSRT